MKGWRGVTSGIAVAAILLASLAAQARDVTCEERVLGADAAARPAQIRIHYQNDRQGPIELRGDGDGLGWEQGVALEADPNHGTATLVYTVKNAELGKPFEFKPVLRSGPLRWAVGANFVLHPGEQLDVYPRFYEKHGEVSTLFESFHSKILGNKRRIWVYLPPGYAENPTARYPVLYMHDGQNLFDPKLAFLGRPWHLNDALDEHGSSGDGTIRDVIVVGIESGDDRIYEMTPTQAKLEGPDGKPVRTGGAESYLRMIVEELKPKIDATLRTIPSETGMGGSSLGGLVTVAAANRHGGLFPSLILMSPAVWYDNGAEARQTESKLKAMPRDARPKRVYVDAGTVSDHLDEARGLGDRYKAAGYREGTDLKFVAGQGDRHDEIAWSGRIVNALRFAFPVEPH